MAILQDLLGKTSVDTFFSEIYEKKILHVPAGRGFEDVLTSAEISNYLDRDDIFYPAVRLVKNGKELPLKDYTIDNVPIGHQKKNGLINTEKMMRLFNSGATIVIQGGQRYFSGITELGKNLSDIFSSPIQANLYITPKKSIGFNPHWDTHDVFVLQIEGSKTWHLYDFEMRLPTKSQAFKGQKLKIEKTQTLQLKAGDFLYVPRGYVHDAIADDGVSAHITIGVLAFTWERFFREAMNELQNHESFRKRVPLNSHEWDFHLQQKIGELKELLLKLDYAKTKAGLEAIQTERQPPGYKNYWRSLLKKDEINATTLIAVNSGIYFKTSVFNNAVHYSFNGKTVFMPLFVKPVMEYIFLHKQFTVGELPNNLNEAGKITLIKKLVTEGLVYCI